MRLRTWIKAAGHGAIAELARQAGVSQSFLSTLVNDRRAVKHYGTAARISAATGGAVSIDELCKLPPPKRRPAMKRKRKRSTAAAVAAAA